VTVVVVLAFFLALNGFLLYRYSQQLPMAGNVTDTQPAAGIDSSTTSFEETTAVEGTNVVASFVHRATSETVVANSSYMNHPLADENPNAILSVERVSQPSGDSDDVHNIGVWYDAPGGGRWAVFNQDLASMSEGTTFDVLVREEPGEDAFVHRATPANIADNSTYVDHPSTNKNPDAVLLVTPNWNAGGGGGLYGDHPVGVRYDAEEQRWAIIYEDLAPMPEGAAFNVALSEQALGRR
jgi:hypothetical protein